MGYEAEQNKECRKVKVLMGSPGGNSGKGSSYYRVAIPPVWAQQMGITQDERVVKLTFDGKRMIVEKDTESDISADHI